MKVDFKKLKTDICLPDLLLDLGWSFAPGSSPSSPKMTDGSQVVVIKRKANGEYTYWDTHSEKRGASVIDIMQQHMFNQTGQMPSLRQVGETLQSYIDSNRLPAPGSSKHEVTSSSLDSDHLAILQNQLRPYSGDFLKRRGISDEALASPTFKDVFYSREFRKDGKRYNNTCVKMVNASGFQGISQRGIREEDQKSFKGVLGYKYGSVAVSRHDPSRPIESVYIGESMIDCVSHYQMRNLNTSRNILYVSTEGSLTQGQLEVIGALIDKQKPRDIITIFDRDKPGYKYALKLSAFLKGEQVTDIESMSSEELWDNVKDFPNMELSMNNDWNDDLKEQVSKRRDIEFHDAVFANDLRRLTVMRTEGYVPSTKSISSLLQAMPESVMITIRNIFGLNNEAPQIKLANRDISYQTKEIGQDLVI